MDTDRFMELVYKASVGLEYKDDNYETYRGCIIVPEDPDCFHSHEEVDELRDYEASLSGEVASFLKVLSKPDTSEHYLELAEKATNSSGYQYDNYETYRGHMIVPDDPDCFQSKEEIDEFETLKETLKLH